MNCIYSLVNVIEKKNSLKKFAVTGLAACRTACMARALPCARATKNLARAFIEKYINCYAAFEQLILTLTEHFPSSLGSVGYGDHP